MGTWLTSAEHERWLYHHGLALPETPFGGVKDSGYGHEGGLEGLTPFMAAKFVTQAGV